MARRPDIFNQNAFEESLRDLGCVDSFIKPITSDFRLFVPLILREIGEDRIFEIAEKSRYELKLGDQKPAWKEASKYIAAWAENGEHC